MSAPLMPVEAARAVRVLVRRESIWSYPAPILQGRPELTVIPPGRLLASAYVVYTAARDIPALEDSLVPVATGLRATRSHVTAGFVQRSSSFDANFLRYALERCHALGLTSVVELSGTWSLSVLKVLWSLRPRYLRVGPEHLHGVSSLPEQYQSLARLSEFAAANGIPLIARGVRTREERAALRAAGVELYHSPESGTEDHDPLAELELTPDAPPPTVLRFPLRPQGR